MNSESFQNTLFEDPIGLRFRHARELAKLSVENVAQKLRLPVAVLEAIEREDWARLGAPIFVRSYVGSYARLLGLPATLADEVVRGKAAPLLAPIGSDAPRRGAFDRGVMNLAYLAMTVLIVGSVVMLAIYFQGPRRTSEVLPLDPPAALVAESAAADPAAQPPPVSPVMASLAPSFPSAPAAAQLKIEFRGPSWIDVTAPDGSLLERGTIASGAVRTFAADRVGGITIGDATAVQVSVDGVASDLSAFREARLARFAVSSRGELLPLPRD
jgi:cytoskeleton protein RodZ